MLQKIKNIFHLFEALTATIIYRFPSKKITVVGVTGTDGKTTTTTLIHHILTSAGIKAAILSTLSSAHTTTPGRFAVQRFLRRSLDNGCNHAVLEVTSIAVDQNRVWGTKFAIGVLTNTADNEHLDYHGTFKQYREAKIKFLLSCPIIIANEDDDSFNYLKSRITTQKLIPYRLPDWQTHRYKTKLIGDFNRYNILAAANAARTLGIDEKTIKNAIATFDSPPGRLEVVVNKPFTVIVDFAHTPQAFEAVLPLVRDLRKSRGSKLIHVFGATGNRDRSKRPIMAKIAAVCDDFIFLTHEDTYSENPKQIISDLEAGLKETNYINYEIVYDRKEAIKKALIMARPGDVVILTGVGHQKTMNIAGQEIPWSEQKVVKETLESNAKR